MPFLACTSVRSQPLGCWHPHLHPCALHADLSCPSQGFVPSCCTPALCCLCSPLCWATCSAHALQVLMQVRRHFPRAFPMFHPGHGCRHLIFLARGMSCVCLVLSFCDSLRSQQPTLPRAAFETFEPACSLKSSIERWMRSRAFDWVVQLQGMAD